jgi:hypothetical protein
MKLASCLAVLALASFTASAHGGTAIVVAKKPSLACPQTELGDPALQARYATIWERYSADVDEATKKVRGELEKQMKSATATGNLDLALFWKTTGKEFEQKGELRWDEASQKKTWGERFGDASFPSEFSVAVKKASEAYASARKNLEKGYGELVAEFTKAEKLEEALKVRGEIKELLAEKTPAPEPSPAPQPDKPKQASVPQIVGMWIGDGGWGNEFLADKTVRNLNPKGQVDTIGTWKDEGNSQYSARLGSWYWQIVLRGDEIQVVRYLNGELKGHGTSKRRR